MAYDAVLRNLAAQAVEPLPVTYEGLVADPVEAVTSVLDFVGAVPPVDWTPRSPHERQADSLNREWVQRYRAAHRGATDAPDR